MFSKISLESKGEDPLQELEQAQSWPETQVGAQEVEEIIEVEADQGGPLGGDTLGEAQHEGGEVGLKGRVETLQHSGRGPQAGQGAARGCDPSQNVN